MKFLLKPILAFTFLSIVFTGCTSTKSTTSLNDLNMVATMQIDEDIDGLCDKENVLVLMSFLDAKQIEAKCLISEKTMSLLFEDESDFLRNNPDYNGEGTLSLIINCNGELIKVSVSSKSKNEELDNEVIAFVKEKTTWEVGTYHDKAVDSSQFLSYNVEQGKLTFN